MPRLLSESVKEGRLEPQEVKGPKIPHIPPDELLPLIKSLELGKEDQRPLQVISGSSWGFLWLIDGREKDSLHLWKGLRYARISSWPYLLSNASEEEVVKLMQKFKVGIAEERERRFFDDNQLEGFEATGFPPDPPADLEALEPTTVAVVQAQTDMEWTGLPDRIDEAVRRINNIDPLPILTTPGRTWTLLGWNRQGRTVYVRDGAMGRVTSIGQYPTPAHIMVPRWVQQARLAGIQGTATRGAALLQDIEAPTFDVPPALWRTR